MPTYSITSLRRPIQQLCLNLSKIFLISVLVVPRQSGSYNFDDLKDSVLQQVLKESLAHPWKNRVHVVGFNKANRLNTLIEFSR
jgi:hypothetical protein